jgi:integrase
MATMRERVPGVWELRVSIPRDPMTGKPRQISRTFRGGKRAANAALSRLVVDHQDGKLGGSQGTVGQLLDEWLRAGTVDITPVTRATYVRTVDLLKPVVGHVRLSRLDAHDIEVAYKQMTEGGLSPFVLKQCHTSLRSALSTGLRWGWVPSNAAKLVKAPKVPRSTPMAPTVGQVTALIRTMETDDPDLAGIVTLAAMTGLRRGEFCGLRWSDIHDGRIHVNRAWVVADGKPTLAGVKMDQSRSSPISDPVWLALSKIASAQLERSVQAGAPLPEDGWVLSMDGLGHDPRKPDHVGRSIANASKRAGAKITPHGLRHFAATVMIAGGVDIRSAASQLGHDPRVLLGHYAAKDPAKERAAADLLGRALTL